MAVIALLLALVAGLADNGIAARDPSFTAVKSASQELVVLEVDDCPICMLVRTEIAPAYARTPRAGTVPMRFVNLRKMDTQHMRLSAPVDVVPTIVVMRDGAEVDRISGYIGPENFLHIIGSMIGPAD